MKRANGSSKTGDTTGGQLGTMEEDLDAMVALALGDQSVRACALDKKCRTHKVPAYIGDYLLARYGDDEAGLQKVAKALFSTYFVGQGNPPIGNETICRVFGMRRMGEDVYGISTPCPLLHRLGIDGSVVRATGLLDGSWCCLAIGRQPVEGFDAFHIFDGVSPENLITPGSIANHSIDALRPVREEAGSVRRLIELRSRLATKDWALLLLRSYGLGGEGLDFFGQLRLLSRLAPLAQPGLRVLIVHEGECAETSEVSPYEVSVEQLRPDHEGFPGSWDCVVASDEPCEGAYGLSMLLDGYEGIAAGVSLAAVSNADEARRGRLTRLFGPFHLAVWAPSNSSEEQMRKTEHLGVNRCLLGEMWHGLRSQDMPLGLARALEDASCLRGGGLEAVSLALAGVAKVLYPTGDVPEVEVRKLLEFVLEQTQPNGR